MAAGACSPSGPDARAAWKTAGNKRQLVRHRLLSYAILAPNPHNMQPWLAELTPAGEIMLFIDRSRLLPVTDPFDRQIVIGCGAFLELLRMAAADAGYPAEIIPFPDGEPGPRLDDRPVARVRFTVAPTTETDPLFRHVLDRRTSRVKFTGAPVDEASARRIAAEALPGTSGGYTVDPARLPDLRALSKEGSRAEAHTPAAHRETCERTFIGAKEVAAHRYGISLEGPAVEAAHAVGLLTQETMATPGTWAYRQAEAFMDPLADSAQGFAWLTTPGNSRAEQLLAGRSYVRMNLAATAEGLAIHPWSQALQEYPSMRPLHERAHRLLAPQGGRVQMFVRIGHVKKPVQPSPRRGLAYNLKKPTA